MNKKKSDDKPIEQLFLDDPSITTESTSYLGPEKYLMFEMLVLSLKDLTSDDKILKYEALLWFDSTEDDYCFSFRNLAEAIGTTPDTIRRELIIPAMNGDYAPISSIAKFAKVRREGVISLA